MATSQQLSLPQIKALASPVRHRLLGMLETHGPLSSRRLAELSGNSPESVHYHLKVMTGARLIQEVGTESTSRRNARLYDLASRSLEANLDGTTPRYREAYAQMSSALIRWADRSHADAVRNPGLVQSGRERDRSVVQFHVNLNRSAVIELNRKLEDLEHFLEANQGDGTPYVVTCVVAPIG